MYTNDPFSQWLGIERVSDEYGANTLRMTVKHDMLNGFDILHGGIAFALADSALAFAANSHGQQCLSVENSIHYHRSCKEGDVLIARATEENRSNRIATYRVVVSLESGEKVATFQGTVYRSKRLWSEHGVKQNEKNEK
ncbi:hotdog fold thioesterase [bacterium SCSIO 12741]|nr:hotdog fold thioesterase [bacterium SCSIO 12741]